MTHKYGMRNSGRTTRQIINAPKDSIYLCISRIEAKKYYQEIAIPNKRQDLTFMYISTFHQERIKGLRKYVVLDHAIKIGIDIHLQLYDYINFRNCLLKSKESNRNDKISKD